MFSSVRKSKPVVGWICGGLSLSIIVLAMIGGVKEVGVFPLVISGIFGIYANIIGAANNSKGQMFLGNLGMFCALALLLFPYYGFWF